LKRTVPLLIKAEHVQSQEETKRLRDENERLKERLSEFEASAKRKAIFSELSTNNSGTPPKIILGIWI
jgi:hypothetical protein